MVAAAAVEDRFRSILSAGCFRAACAEESICGSRPRFFAEPRDERQLAALLACANEEGIAVIPRGGGTKLDWGNRPKRADLILSTAALNGIREHAWADLTVTVEAGCTLQTLQETLAQHGQRLALDALWPERATVGGVLSTNDSGALRLRFGALRDLIIGVTLALPDGTIASSGGKVVKNVAGYDLPKLATGAFGTLGVITRAVFRVHPLPGGSRTFSFTAGSLEEMQQLLLSIQDSQLAHTAFQIRCGSESPPVADVLIEGAEAGLNALENRLRNLLGTIVPERPAEQVWGSRQGLFAFQAVNAFVAKIVMLPSDFARTLQRLERIARSLSVGWQLVLQASGVGALLMEGQSNELRAAVDRLRAALEPDGASLVLLRRHGDLEALDAWGNPGDAIALMRAVKYQLDPKSTINSGRFVGGI